MPIASNNEFPSVLIKEGTAPATPAAGDQRLYIKSADHLPYLINSAGTSTAIGGGSGAMTQIQKITNGSTSAMTFSSIPGTYNALLLVLQARAASAAGVAYQLLQFNGDTGANYAYSQMFGSGGTPFAAEGSSVTSIRAGYLSDTTATANYAGLSQILIPNYAGTSFFKQCLTQTFASPDNTAGNYTILAMGGQWASTAAITSITLVNTMLVNSVGVLYGIA